MNSEYLFAMALGIGAPWEVISVEFKQLTTNTSKVLYINIDFKKGSKRQFGEIYASMSLQEVLRSNFIRGFFSDRL
jgi:hypothetical protein